MRGKRGMESDISKKLRKLLDEEGFVKSSESGREGVENITFWRQRANEKPERVQIKINSKEENDIPKWLKGK